jgi:hypothetical protein
MSEAAQRDALAWKIEQVAIAVFAVLLVVAVALIVRDRRRRAARV